jgi:signal transduction histidine kinase
LIPFVAIAVLAELSLALPPGPRSASAVTASVVLLLATAAAFLVPWSQLPTWMPVLVPIVYTGSVLALVLAAGSTSGVGIVILIPLVWTALFHRAWESACIVAAIVAVEVIISLTPAAAPDAVIARRVILWAALGTVISVAVHGLRDHIRRSQEETAQLEARLRELTVLQDRDRIAADLQDKVIQRVFAVGLTLQGAATLTASGRAGSSDECEPAVELTAIRDAATRVGIEIDIEPMPDGTRFKWHVPITPREQQPTHAP